MEPSDIMESTERMLFYQKLIEEYKNDTVKLECMLTYLTKDESFTAEYNNMRDLTYQIRNASFYCETSVLNSPLGIAILVSLIYLSFTIVGILIYFKIRRK
ncbi:hypothetical protein ACKWTF_011916 [Chironomus riparius]